MGARVLLSLAREGACVFPEVRAADLKADSKSISKVSFSDPRCNSIVQEAVSLIRRPQNAVVAEISTDSQYTTGKRKRYR